MKKLVLSFAMVVLALGGVVAQELFIGPAIQVDKEVHDYGTIDNGAEGTCIFTVTNVGTEPLIIAKCKGSCGCTVPTCDPVPILPGESSEIKVKYDTKRTGPINKSVTITSNATNEPTKVVRIKGKVLAANSDASPVKVNSGAPVN